MTFAENMKRKENGIIFSAFPVPEFAYTNITLWRHNYSHYLKWFTNNGITIVKC